MTDCVVDIEAERATTDPKVFTKIQMHYTVTGHALSIAKKVERAPPTLSAEKYCSASAIMAKTRAGLIRLPLSSLNPTYTGATA